MLKRGASPVGVPSTTAACRAETRVRLQNENLEVVSLARDEQMGLTLQPNCQILYGLGGHSSQMQVPTCIGPYLDGTVVS